MSPGQARGVVARVLDFDARKTVDCKRISVGPQIVVERIFQKLCTFTSEYLEVVEAAVDQVALRAGAVHPSLGLSKGQTTFIVSPGGVILDGAENPQGSATRSIKDFVGQHYTKAFWASTAGMFTDAMRTVKQPGDSQEQEIVVDVLGQTRRYLAHISMSVSGNYVLQCYWWVKATTSFLLASVLGATLA